MYQTQRKPNRIAAFLVCASLILSLSACATGQKPETYAAIIKEETPNFVSGSDQLKCTVEISLVPTFGFSKVSSDCLRNIELMVYASQRVVKKFQALGEPSEAKLKPLIYNTVQSLDLIGMSGFEKECTSESIRDSIPEACSQAIKTINGGEDLVLDNAWKALNAWQVYF